MAVAAIYARYSSAGQREESIEDQVRVCTEAAERAGDNVVRVYQDRASTGTSVDHRHGFLQMVADGQRGAFEVLYVYKTDRFARNRYDSAVYKMRLRRAGVRVVSATERIEDGPDGILLESVLEGMAEYYSANLSENVRRGLDGNAEKCRHNGVRTFGYELGADGYFALDEVEAPVVLGCFEAYADGMGMPEICAEYSWVRTKMGKPLTVSMLSRMLRNEKYRGRYSYGGHVVEGGMPRIVSDELFYAVQRMLAAATRRRRGVMDYLLTGKLFDEEGHRYQSQSGHGKSGRKYTYYKCPATGHAVRQDALEAEVARGVAGILEADDDAVAAIVAMVLAEQDEAAAGKSRTPALATALAGVRIGCEWRTARNLLRTPGWCARYAAASPSWCRSIASMSASDQAKWYRDRRCRSWRRCPATSRRAFRRCPKACHHSAPCRYDPCR